MIIPWKIEVKYPDTLEELFKFEEFLRDNGFIHFQTLTTTDEEVPRDQTFGWHIGPCLFFPVTHINERSLSVQEFLNTYRFHVYLYQFKL